MLVPTKARLEANGAGLNTRGNTQWVGIRNDTTRQNEPAMKLTRIDRLNTITNVEPGVRGPKSWVMEMAKLQDGSLRG